MMDKDSECPGACQVFNKKTHHCLTGLFWVVVMVRLTSLIPGERVTTKSLDLLRSYPGVFLAPFVSKLLKV
jgi:hypothetical protein